jgi:hypothetical protein
MLRFLTVAVALVVTAPATAATQTHRIYSITRDTTSDCGAFVSSIAEKIALRHQVRIVAALCQTSGGSDRLTGFVSYDADTALTEVSSYTLASTYARKGIFADRATCEQALAEEVDTFARQTGLSPAYSFCNREPLGSRHSWYPYITAFGESVKTPRRTSWHSDTPHGTPGGDLLHTLNRHFADRGLEFQHLTYHAGGAGGDLSAYYYGPVDEPGVNLQGSSVATIPGLATCTAAAERLRQDRIFVGGKPMVLAYCSSGYSNPSKFELVVLSEGLVFLDSIQDSRPFESLESCEAARPVIEQELGSIHGDKLVLTVCGHPRFSLARGAPFFVIGAKTY